VRVLFVQPALDPPGGGNLVAAWMLEALRDEHALHLVAWRPPDLDACNRFYGTSLRPFDFELELVPAAARWLARPSPLPLALLRHAYLVRRSARQVPRHDVLVTADNETDFGRRGIQYVHYPKLAMARPAVDLHWYHASRALLELYYRTCARLCRFSAERMRANLTLVNSDWIGGRVRALHGIEPITLHPPVPGVFPAVPWEKRENGFVCIGRISPEKRIETMIDVVARVRARGGDVRLHIVGTDDHGPYTRMIRGRVRENAAWVSLHEDLPRAELLRLVAHQRYGIHAMPDEHFGIAVAELVRGGCIVFVPNDGGPVEIVGRDDRLLYGSREEAVEKILATLGDADRQASLRARLAGRADLFSTARFVTRLRDIVREFAAA
jgi:glycosyltransferase involved in cell wall biosynthesis